MGHQTNVTLNNVYYWEAILEKGIAKLSPIIEAKQRKIMYLQNLPFDQKIETNQKVIRLLEEELDAFLGVILTISKLKDSYIETTAAMAETLRVYNIKQDFFYKELISRGGTEV